jgi:arylsulfatase A-like enzyme
MDRMNDQNRNRPGRTRFAVLLTATILLAFFQAACSGASDYNVLLLTLDTTRADHLRCYGYKNIETPTLNDLARDGVLFKRAYSQLPMTLPAHTAILSGTYPLYNGVLDNGDYRVPDELLTLPEMLKPKGYTTAAFISAAVLKKNFNLNQGFDYWNEDDIQPQKEMTALVAERKANVTTDAVLKWLEQNYKKRWFLWVHYYDPHREFNPPEPFFHLYFFDEYAGEIAFMDSQIKRLTQFLDKNKLADRTIVIAIADHGESLGEHDENTHAIYIYESTQHIPFIIRVPGLKNTNRAISKIVSQVDVVPTVLDFLSIPIPGQVKGRSLKKLILGQEKDGDSGEAFLESHYPFLHYGWSELFGLVTSQYKYIQAPKPELYDLFQDFREEKNIVAENQKLAKEFDFKIEELKKSSRSKLALEARKGTELDEQTQKQLEALGYASGIANLDPERAKTKNPKDFSGLLTLLSSMNNDHIAGRYKVLLSKSETVLDSDPENILALRMKEDALFGMGRYEEAVEWINKVMALTGESADYYFLLGTCYLRMEKVELARSAFEKSLKIDPNKKFSRYFLARILLSTGKGEEALKLVEENKIRETGMGHLFMAIYYQTVPGREGKAEAEFELALEQMPKNAVAKLEYAGFLVAIGRPSKSLELIDEAEKLDPSFKADAKIQKLKENAKKAAGKGT